MLFIRNLAAIGAVVMILCLPLDLFFQQIVNYERVFITVDMNATLPRATMYKSVGPLITGGSVGIGPDDAMENVINPHFYANGTMPALRSYCPTSNCTWEPFETLAVCSKCESMPDLLEYGCFDGPASWLADVFDYSGKTPFPNMTQCGWYLNMTDADSRVLMTGYVVDNETGLPGESLDTRFFPLIDAFTFEPYFGGSINFKDHLNAILDVLVVSSPGGRDDLLAQTRPVVSECLLTWCTQTLQSYASWGSISENITSVFNLTSTTFPISSTEDDYFYDHDINMIPPNQHSVTFQDQSIATTPRTFGLSNDTALQTIFAGQVIAPSVITTTAEGTAFKYKWWAPEGGAFRRSMQDNLWTSAASVTSRFEAIAKAMTIVVRNNPLSDGSQELIIGTSWNERTHVDIRWAWIILPLVLLALSLVLLIGTVIKSTREESVVGIWKTSVVAILFNGIDETVQRSVGPNCRMTEARAKAKEFTVKLVPE